VTSLVPQQVASLSMEYLLFHPLLNQQTIKGMECCLLFEGMELEPKPLAAA
jgi:hypothetical protein